MRFDRFNTNVQGRSDFLCILSLRDQLQDLALPRSQLLEWTELPANAFQIAIDHGPRNRWTEICFVLSDGVTRELQLRRRGIFKHVASGAAPQRANNVFLIRV